MISPLPSLFWELDGFTGSQKKKSADASLGFKDSDAILLSSIREILPTEWNQN